MTDATGKRYCEDCRFCFVPPSGVQYARCLDQRAIETAASGERFVSPQFDTPDKTHRYASIMRVLAEHCGHDAKWFEPKQADAVAA